jgi:hypothetical protein
MQSVVKDYFPPIEQLCQTKPRWLIERQEHKRVMHSLNRIGRDLDRMAQRLEYRHA